jgi:nucleotide-binding universal stress UspA family protein
MAGADDFLPDLLARAHGWTGIKRLVIGNVAEKVVRHAPGRCTRR